MRMWPHARYLLALAGRKTIYGRQLPTKELARDLLCKLTGVDFGYDVMAWKEWIRNNRKGLYSGRSDTGER